MNQPFQSTQQFKNPKQTNEYCTNDEYLIIPKKLFKLKPIKGPPLMSRTAKDHRIQELEGMSIKQYLQIFPRLVGSSNPQARFVNKIKKPKKNL